MPVLTAGKTVRSAKPTLLVENAFKPGAYRFELVVVDDAGNVSAPASLTVTVRGTNTPRIPGRVVTRGGTPTPVPTPAPSPVRTITNRVTPAPPPVPPKPTRPRG